MDIIAGTYGDLRNSLKDGQLVFIRGNTLFQKFVKLVTNGEYTHCGILVWMTDQNGYKNLMVIESSIGGTRIVTLRSYVHRGFTLVDMGFDWIKHGPKILDETGSTHYSIFNFITIGVKELLLRAGLTKLAGYITHKGSGEVCSEFIADELRAQGMEGDIAISPSALYKKLLLLPITTSTIEIAAQNDLVLA